MRQDQDWEGESPDVSGDEGAAGRRRGAAGGWLNLFHLCWWPLAGHLAS
jgi:hypothetical protein